MEKALLLTLVVRAGRNAGLKAPMDICRILEQTGEVENAVFYTERGQDFPVYLEMLDLVRKTVREGRRIILQYPLQPAEYHEKQKEFMSLLKELDPDRTMILMHDINHIRYPEVELYGREMDMLGRFRYFIVHNGKMEDYLRQFIPDSECVRLELFDYLCRPVCKTAKQVYQPGADPRIVFAGSLTREKAPFLFELEKEKMCFELAAYGNRAGRVANGRIKFGGSVDAEALPGYLTGDLGLIWDGTIDAPSDRLAQRRYNRYNTPHKISCYLAAGLPVIAWREAAIAEVIEKYRIGYLMENLYELNRLNLSQYEEYRKNAAKLSGQVTTGYFTGKMWEKVRQWCEPKQAAISHIG